LLANVARYATGMPIRSSSRKAVVIISGRERQTVTLETSTMRETHSFAMLLDDHRRGATKEWVTQVPVLVARLEAVFAKERQEGKDPQHFGG